MFQSFVAGIQATMCDFTLLYAPNINSYKRFHAGTLRTDGHRAGATTTAPARCAWSVTAPGCGWRTGCPAAT